MFVDVIWPIGIQVSGGLGLLVAVVWWLRNPDADIATAVTIAMCVSLAGTVWPLWPLAIPAYGLYKLRLRLHPQLRIPLEDARGRARLRGL